MGVACVYIAKEAMCLKNDELRGQGLHSEQLGMEQTCGLR